MSGNVRIEKCPSEDAATRRKAALEADGFTVKVAPASACVVTIDVNDDGTLPVTPAVTLVECACVLLAIRAT
ncbi:MAG TPA: hypothetical protein VD995_07595 [Azospirillum sp.]|nr:hypothetical protein [Azospirillum sp.]